MTLRTGAIVVLLGALVVGLVEARARAQDAAASGPVRLSWVRTEGAESCAAADTLAADVRARLGRDPFGEPATRLIEGLVVRDGARWVARIFVRDRSGALLGSRVIESGAAACASLDGAAGLALALAIDPNARMTTGEPSPPAASTSAPATAEDNVARDGDAGANAGLSGAEGPARVEATTTATRSAGVSMRLVVSPSVLPKWAVGIAVTTDAPLTESVRYGVGATLWPEARTPDPDPNFAFGLAAISAGICWAALRAERLTGAICGSVLAGVMHAVVYHPDPLAPGDRFWLGATAGVRGTATVVEPLWLEIGVEALVPITRYDFRVEGRPSSAWTQAVIAPVAFVGAGVHFW